MNNSIVYLIAALGIAYGIGTVFRLWLKEGEESRALRSESNAKLPDYRDLREGVARARISTYAKLEHLRFILDAVEPKARAGILQEEAVLAAVHDRIVNATNVLREASSVYILGALTITFYMLYTSLSGIIRSQVGALTSDSLRPVVSLVGANWPLIFAGLVLYVCSAIKQHLDWKRFYAWQEWLETKIFPELGVSRSTADQLSKALLTFNETAGRICEAVLPLQGLKEALGEFQCGLVTELVPAVQRSLANVSVTLSDQAVEGLRDVTRESVRILHGIQDNQARILTIVVASEQRSAAIAAAVEKTTQHTSTVAIALAASGTRIEENTSAMTSFTSTISHRADSWIEKVVELHNSIAEVKKSIDTHADTTWETALRISRLDTSMGGVADRAASLGEAMVSNAVRLAQVQASLTSILSPLQRTSDSISSFGGRVEGLESRWQDAMLQMATLTEQVNQRTSELENASTQLSISLRLSTDRLSGVEESAAGMGRSIDRLQQTAAAAVEGNKQIVASFAELQSLGQKLKNMGHSITGHFDVWQRETKDVFRTAQDSSAAISNSFAEISSLVRNLENAVLSSAIGTAGVVPPSPPNGTAHTEQAIPEAPEPAPLIYVPYDTRKTLPPAADPRQSTYRPTTPWRSADVDSGKLDESDG